MPKLIPASFISLFLLSSFALAAPSTDKALVNSLSMKLVRIEPGEFVMGQGDAAPKTKDEWQTRDWDESPAHRVKITASFFMGAHEVTNAQFEQFDPAHTQKRKSGEDNMPAVHVTWQQAADFCAWLSKKEGRPYRLPTEAEWEYACRAGTTTMFNTGDKLDPADANIATPLTGKLVNLKPVGSYKPNAWGLSDMHGNAAEWCADWWGPYEAGEQTDPVGRVDGDFRIVRGWSCQPTATFKDASRFARSANRSAKLIDDPDRFTGFRVVLGEAPKTSPPPVAPVSRWQRDVKQSPAPKEGPDPVKPFFVDYTAEKKNPIIPADNWGPIFTKHNHYGGCCVCPNGDVLGVWYTCVDEPGRELGQAVSRLRAGSDTWEPPQFFFGTPDVNTHAPTLFSDGKRIYHFFNQGIAGWDGSSVGLRTSDDNGVTWSKPRIIYSRDNDVVLSQPCSAYQAATGEIVLAIDGDNHKHERLLVSADRGQTWKLGPADMREAVGKYAIHPAIAAGSTGGLLCFLRGPDPMPMLFAKDPTSPWEVRPTPFPGISSGQKPSALRLASGALLLCSPDQKSAVAGGRTFAALSYDDGKTWPHVKRIDGAYGYMAAAQAPNGVIYLFGTKASAVAFNEAWVKEGKPYPAQK